MQIAQAYLQHGDPVLAKRTWQDVMDAMAPLKTGPAQSRWQSAMRDKSFDLIRSHKLIETASEHFLQVLNAGTISINMFLRRLHNFAIGMHWLPWPVLPKLHWPPVRQGPAGDHSGGAPEDYRARAQPGNSGLLSTVVALGRLANRHRGIDLTPRCHQCALNFAQGVALSRPCATAKQGDKMGGGQDGLDRLTLFRIQSGVAVVIIPTERMEGTTALLCRLHELPREVTLGSSGRVWAG